MTLHTLLLVLIIASGSTRAELRVPASTAYLAPDPDAARISATRPIVPFTRAGSSIVWHGKFSATGQLTASVVMQLAVGDSVRLRLMVGKERRDATAMGGVSEVRVAFGAYTITDTGYQRFELMPIDRKATSMAEVRAFQHNHHRFLQRSDGGR